MRTHDAARQGDIGWRDKVVIARHEVMCAAIIVADVLNRRDAGEPDFARLALVLQRLRSLVAAP